MQGAQAGWVQCLDEWVWELKHLGGSAASRRIIDQLVGFVDAEREGLLVRWSASWLGWCLQDDAVKHKPCFFYE